jgi:hypothetical protein
VRPSVARRQYGIANDAANHDRVMQLITEVRPAIALPPGCTPPR